MKTRTQIINEILEKNKTHDLVNRQATLDYALKTMQDALLFSLAQDLEIDLDSEEAPF